MQLRRDFLRSIEAGIIGLFLIQSIRFLYGTLYAHVSSADLVRRVADAAHLINQPGYIKPATVENELLAVGFALLAPLLALFFARTHWSIPLAVALCVVGRSMALQVPESAALAAALVVGAALLYMVLIIIYRPNQFPLMLLIGLALDQLIRAMGNTADPTWKAAYQFNILGQSIRADNLFLGITIFTLILAGYTTLVDLDVRRYLAGQEPERQGLLTGWGSLALGSFLFLELTVLGLANVLAHWAEIAYADVVPWLLLATMLPLIPAVRDQARIFLGAFDGIWRGWLWALLLGLLLILGNRFEGVLALVVLVLAQFLAALTPWWMIRLRDPASNLPNPTPILMLMSILVFGILSAGDYFTYDYAFVRDIAEPFTFLADIFRAFRGMGLFLGLLASLLLCMPMILERRVIPWKSGRTLETFFSGLIVILLSLSSLQSAAPPAIQRPQDINCLRIATLNMHSGYTLLFEQNPQRIVDALSRRRTRDGTILDLGVDILLLQEVDAGRLSSFGVDQAEWLARELQMESVFFAQNEALQGIAILSRVPIASMRGEKLASNGPQAAVMHVELAIDGDPFHIYNVWLGFQTTDENGQPLPPELQDQTAQTSALEQLIARNHAPNFDQRLVLGGTFNYDRSTPLYNFWANDTTFMDPFKDLAIERAKTLYLVDNTAARYDYIWLMNLESNGVVIDQDYIVSDHRLAMVQVKRTPDQQCS